MDSFLFVPFCLFVQLEVPTELISSMQLQELRLQRSPSFAPLSHEVNTPKVHDKDTGITQRRLSNGIPVNYKVHMVLFMYIDVYFYNFLNPHSIHSCTKYDLGLNYSCILVIYLIILLIGRVIYVLNCMFMHALGNAT